MKSIYYRLPAFLCGAICCVAFLGTLREHHWWQPIFFAFLPTCFLIAGSQMVHMKREISRLRRRVAKLEQEEREESHGSASHDILADAR
jgi:hypothetical protein